MARCKDCIHNKICDEWAVTSGIPFVNSETCEHFKPTADVVPKSEVEALEKEVERLQMILDSYALQYGTVMDKYIVIERARAEVASEIFEEIETIVDNNTYKSYLPNSSLWSKEYKIKQIITELAELKKKYAEVINNGHA